MIRRAIDKLQPLRARILEIGFRVEIMERLPVKGSHSESGPPTTDGINGHTLGQLATSSARVRSSPSCRLRTSKMLFAELSSKPCILLWATSRICWWQGGANHFLSYLHQERDKPCVFAYIKQASARAHHEPSLVELSSARRIVVRLAVGQVRPCVGNVDHGRKLRVPRPKFHWSYLSREVSNGPHSTRRRPAFTSYTVDAGSSDAVESEPTGRESAWMIGNGTRCCCHDGISGTSDHS